MKIDIYNPDGTMNPDYQEAESHRYSNLAVFMLPLSSGKIAVLDEWRNLIAIVASFEEALASYRGWSPPSPPPATNRARPKVLAKPPGVKITLKDLGL